jgi:glycosyltransferase involved in cell wall biosynthesis
MNIAFYAPMKSPHHPRPSGDRRIGRVLIKALELGGFNIEVMSDLRAWEGHGEQSIQLDIREKAAVITDRILTEIHARTAKQKPDIWFSYHLYHKAPDWIGPRIAAELQIPYVVAEASYSAKQAHGAWSSGLQQVVHALDQAAAIICLNPRDIPALEQLPASANKIHTLLPFIDVSDIKLTRRPVAREKLARQYDLNPDLPWIISVAMMRDDTKLVSYRYLVKCLKQVTQAYQLLLIGDGKARHKVEAMFGGEISPYTRYTGQLDQAATLQALIAGDLFVWPAINEAIGMAILEAQACGLPVVAGSSGAIPEIVHDGKSGFLCPPDDTQEMAKRVEQLLEDVKLREQFSLTARSNIEQHHTLQAAASSIEQILSGLHP